MGGFGSGRSGWHRKAEEMLCLNVNAVQRRGFLAPGASCLWTWTWTTGEKSSISLQAFAGALRLDFRVRSGGEEWRNVVQTVEIVRTACNYGGTRPWFRCPRCGRSVAVLFGAALFLCRKCHNLAYRSQSESHADRCYRRANKLRARLGGEPGALSLLPKPKWMRWATYDRMEQEIRVLETSGLLAAMLRFPELAKFWEI